MAHDERRDDGHLERPAGEKELTVRMGPSGDWMLLHVAGELDLRTLALLGARLDLAEEVIDPPMVAVELSDLRFCDSSGLNLLVRAHKRLVAKGGRLMLIRPTGQLKRLLKWTGLYQILDVSPRVVPG